MLFNSTEFLLFFLPTVLALFYLGYRLKISRAPHFVLLAGSLTFYGWWDASYLALLIGSIAVNYLVARLLFLHSQKKVLVGGIIFNIALLAYFKYANFVINNLNLFGFEFKSLQVLLPLAISFFTFQQIAFLVDCYRGKLNLPDFFDYALFVTFFPQLIAGPIVHHSEMMPQFKKSRELLRPAFSLGVTIFSWGLFKKIVIADGISPIAQNVFSAAEAGEVIMFFQGWAGALAYTFQIYFDFSGYSDMAIGLGLLFGIRLPLNFFSPYKSYNIVEFWRRWHITLSRFLKDYLYIPLGGNRKGQLRRYANLLITMLLGGLWHGASWTFAAWGFYHGLLLAVVHGWHKAKKAMGLKEKGIPGRILARLLCFVAVVLGWVVFRAETWPAAQSMLTGMLGFEGIALHLMFAGLGDYLPGWFHFGHDAGWIGSLNVWQLLWLLPLLFVVHFLPNVYQVLKVGHSRVSIEAPEVLESELKWGVGRVVAVGLVIFITISFLGAPSEFLYYRF